MGIKFGNKNGSHVRSLQDPVEEPLLADGDVEDPKKEASMETAAMPVPSHIRYYGLLSLPEVITAWTLRWLGSYAVYLLAFELRDGISKYGYNEAYCNIKNPDRALWVFVGWTALIAVSFTMRIMCLGLVSTVHTAAVKTAMAHSMTDLRFLNRDISGATYRRHLIERYLPTLSIGYPILAVCFCGPLATVMILLLAFPDMMGTAGGTGDLIRCPWPTISVILFTLNACYVFFASFARDKYTGWAVLLRELIRSFYCKDVATTIFIKDDLFTTGTLIQFEGPADKDGQGFSLKFSCHGPRVNDITIIPATPEGLPACIKFDYTVRRRVISNKGVFAITTHKSAFAILPGSFSCNEVNSTLAKATRLYSKHDPPGFCQ